MRDNKPTLERWVEHFEDVLLKINPESLIEKSEWTQVESGILTLLRQELTSTQDDQEWQNTGDS